MAVQESLRIQPPVATISNMNFTKDVRLGKIDVQKGDDVTISAIALHHNSHEWPEPHLFIPERFDSKSQHSLNAKG